MLTEKQKSQHFLNKYELVVSDEAVDFVDEWGDSFTLKKNERVNNKELLIDWSFVDEYVLLTVLEASPNSIKFKTICKNQPMNKSVYDSCGSDHAFREFIIDLLRS